MYCHACNRLLTIFRKVFLCKNLTNNNYIVIKQISGDELPPEERKSAMNEVNVLSMFQHPNIIAYYSSFVEEKSLTIHGVCAWQYTVRTDTGEEWEIH